jgi:CobQ-like glutamine amidotransferase family enzyme
MGRAYTDATGSRTRGLGVLDLETQAGAPRLVGEVVVRTSDGELLTGFENHAGRTLLGHGVEPLGTVVRGGGNNDADGTEGARQGALIGTYLHGPVLARNPRLADWMLATIMANRGKALAELEPAGQNRAAELHLARLEAALAHGRRHHPRRRRA